jgi:glycosyltransferase involved in cell wall biosynthesis
MKSRILMIAYACDPRGSGEHWLGWGWAEQAARRFEVDLITTPKARAAVEESSRPLGITPHFVEVTPWLRKLTETLGGSWLRKLSWQKRALALATALHREKDFALVHQTTFHTFRTPFRAAQVIAPSVWGPIAGGERVPPGFGRFLGEARFAEFGRHLLNRIWLHVPAVKRSLRKASVLLVSNHTTLDFLPAACRAKSRIVPPNALRPEDEHWGAPAHPAQANGTPLKLLYVGNCVATRALPIVFEALRLSGLVDFEFSVVGGGPALDSWRKQAQELGLEAKVKFAGKVPYAQLNQYYAAADVLVFPALRDSGGSALLEAMARYLPVICLDWAGPGEMVDALSGIKIPVREPQETIKAFAAALNRLHQDRALRASLALAARARAQALFRWDAKRELLEEIYERLIRHG